LHQSIQDVENHTHQNDRQGHHALSSQTEREYKGTLEIMQLEKEKKRQSHQVATTVG